MLVFYKNINCIKGTEPQIFTDIKEATCPPGETCYHSSHCKRKHQLKKSTKKKDWSKSFHRKKSPSLCQSCHKGARDSSWLRLKLGLWTLFECLWHAFVLCPSVVLTFPSCHKSLTYWSPLLPVFSKWEILAQCNRLHRQAQEFLLHKMNKENVRIFLMLWQILS